MESSTYPIQYPPAQLDPNSGIDPRDQHRPNGRTPSPTLSEAQVLSGRLFNPKKLLNWKFWARKAWIKWYIIAGFFLVITILVSAFDKQIVHALQPAGEWARETRLGWLVPVAILFILSFPPLFGHEIVGILVGAIWGFWIGFAIVGAGTFLGEIGNYYAFKYLCRARGEKFERTNLKYACLAEVVRQGGFKMAFIIRLSFIPPHFTTAVFSTCGMSIIIFALAAFFSLPKQAVIVYLGVTLERSGLGTETTGNKIISLGFAGITIFISGLAAWYVLSVVEKVKPVVIYNRRKARQSKPRSAGYIPNDHIQPTPVIPSSHSSTLKTYNPHLIHPSPRSVPHGGISNMEYAEYAQGPSGVPGDQEMLEQGWKIQPIENDLRGTKLGIYPLPPRQPEPAQLSNATSCAPARLSDPIQS